MSESGEMGWPKGPIFAFVADAVKAEVDALNPRWSLQWRTCRGWSGDETEYPCFLLSLGWDGTHDQHLAYQSGALEFQHDHAFEVKRAAADLCIDALEPEQSPSWRVRCGCE